jgi:hypothetical protein
MAVLHFERDPARRELIRVGRKARLQAATDRSELQRREPLAERPLHPGEREVCGGVLQIAVLKREPQAQRAFALAQLEGIVDPGAPRRELGIAELGVQPAAPLRQLGQAVPAQPRAQLDPRMRER